MVKWTSEQSSCEKGYDYRLRIKVGDIVVVVWWASVSLLSGEGDKFRLKMADLEAVLADVSYLMAMEKSKCTPAARASKKIVLPDPR